MKSHLFPARGRSKPLFTPLARAASRFARAVLAASVLFAAGPLQALESEVVVQGDEMVLGILKAAPPKELSDKIMAVARKIQPGPQTEALPFILGGMLGDPTLEGISAEHNLGLVLIATGETVAPVLLLRLPEESPVRQSLAGFDLAVRDIGDWTFALPADASFALVEGRHEELIAAVEGDRRYDLELTADLAALARKAREATEAFPAGADTGIMTALVKPFLDGLVTEAEAIEDFRSGLNISADELQQISYLKAAGETPLAQFLHQERPEDLGFARFIRANGAIAYLGGIDAEATRRYVDHFFRQLASGAGSEPEWWGKMRVLATEFFEKSNGASAGVMSFAGMEFRSTQIAHSTMSDEELLKMLERSVELMAEAMKEAETGEAEVMPSYELLPNQLQVGEIPVHILRTEVKLDEEQAQELQEQMPGFSLPAQRQDMHYALVDDYLVNATEAAELSAVIEAIQKGEPVENNLADLISISGDDLFDVRIDLLRYFGGIMAPFMTPEMAQVVENLDEKGLDPVRSRISARNGEGEMSVAIPVDTVAAVFQAISGFVAAQQQQPQQEVEPFPAP